MCVCVYERVCVCVYERVYACVGVGVCVSMCMCTGERERG